MGSRCTWVALVATIVGGSILAAEFFWVLPTALGATGWSLFFLGVIVVFVCAAREARRSGTSIVSALGRGFRAAGRWLMEMMP